MAAFESRSLSLSLLAAAAASLVACTTAPGEPGASKPSSAAAAPPPAAAPAAPAAPRTNTAATKTGDPVPAPSARAPGAGGADTAARGSASGPSAAASAPSSNTAAAGSSTGAAPAGLAGPGGPGGPGSGPPPFATVIREAKRVVTDGPIAVWQKDDKVWLELKPEDFGRPFLLSPKIKNGIGEGWILGGLMGFPINGAGGVQLVEFVKVHNNVRMQARNTDVLAKAGTPEARTVAEGYSASLLASSPVASQAHPERKSVLVEANAFFLNDIMGLGMMLQRSFRQGYTLERSNTTITAVRANKDALVLETQMHYFTGNVTAILPFNAPPGMPLPSIPRYLPDSRSMLIGLHFSLAPLPEMPMQGRKADPRVGYFNTTLLDFSDDLNTTPRQRVVNRWRLEKRDPDAALSVPVKPITFWVDRNVPLAYRETVMEGILEWNKAFERIGFKDAIVARQQPDDAKWETLDFGYASVRWMMNAEPSFGAIGPSHVDPRSGEILDADIAFEGMSVRSARTLRTQVLPAAMKAQMATTVGAGVPGLSEAFAGMDVPAAPGQEPGLLPTLGQHPLAKLQSASAGAVAAQAGLGSFSKGFADPHRWCQHGALAAEQMGYALDVLQARGDLDPDSPAAQRFVLDYIKESIMHEVGHALGLRHNFRASRVYTEAQLADADFTRANGTTGSVMDYNAVNLPRPGQKGGAAFSGTLGPYDYWAIEYAYKPAAKDASAEDELKMLQSIAARSKEPQLAFGTDEDAFFGIDPEVLMMDLGSDPVAFAKKRLDIARDLFKRQERRDLPEDRNYAVLRRSLGFALGDTFRSVGVLVRQIGGMRTLRDYPGSGREPLQPLEVASQREALNVVLGDILSPQGLAISPALARKLAPDYLDRAEMGGATDYSVARALLDLQRAVLGYLMSEWVSHRIHEGAEKVDKPSDALQIREIYEPLFKAVWGELDQLGPVQRGQKGTAGPVQLTQARRELQRDHASRLALLAMRPSIRVDSRSLLREQARSLVPKLEAAAKTPGLDVLTRGHFLDCAHTLKQALEAQLPRLGL